MTVLRFPTDRIVGTLDWNGSWSAETGPVLARGDVDVPDGAVVRLEVQELRAVEPSGGWGPVPSFHPVDLGFLADLPPDGIGSMSVRSADERSFGALRHLYLEEETLTAAAFAFVDRLPRLVRLGLQDVDLDDAELETLRSRLPGVQVDR